MSDYYSEARRAVCDFVQTVKFNGVLVIVLNSHDNTISNWWHFSGHPSTWKTEELSGLAQQMASSTAELLKIDINNPSGRYVSVKSPVIAKLINKSSEGWINLCGISIKLLNKKRLGLSLWFCNWQFGINVSWYSGVKVLIGPF